MYFLDYFLIAICIFIMGLLILSRSDHNTDKIMAELQKQHTETLALAKALSETDQELIDLFALIAENNAK